MDAAIAEAVPRAVEGNTGSTDPFSQSLGIGKSKHLDLTLDALKLAIAEPGDHRLFRSGKLAGLFPTRTGASADAALAALSDGLLEAVRTEAKGKVVTEWVRVTPAGVAFVHDRDSPKAVLRELRDVLGTTRAGVPAWMDDARREIAAASERFEERAGEILRRLDGLAERVEAALRRAEAAGPDLPDPLKKVVPWGPAALAYLDSRMGTDCPLGELFAAVRAAAADLTVPEFHDGLRRLHDVRAVRLVPGSAAAAVRGDPEFAIIVGAEVCLFARR